MDKAGMTDAFDQFWARWRETVGRSVAKKSAERAYTAALKETTPEVILARLERRYREEWALRKMEFRPHCSTWLRSEDWDERTELLVDEAPLFAGHSHFCGQCETPHDWDCAEDLCWLSHDVICESALNAHKSRIEEMRKR